MIVNGFEIKPGPKCFVDCVAWDGTVMNTFCSACEAIRWAQQEQAPTLSPGAKGELEKLRASLEVAA